MENNNLSFHLQGTITPVLDWPTRLSIALGAAKGIAYLHEECQPRIIHRDIKSTNILLDFNFRAKVADFGLAKLVPDDKTHVTTRIMGTFGYLAPEFGSSGRLTEKSDVFSFGIVLLEFITGRQPINLVEWASPFLDQALEDGDFETQLIDPKLECSYDHEEMNGMVTCAAISVHRFRDHRPQMSQGLEILLSWIANIRNVYMGRSDAAYVSPIHRSMESSKCYADRYNCKCKKSLNNRIEGQDLIQCALPPSSSLALKLPTLFWLLVLMRDVNLRHQTRYRYGPSSDSFKMHLDKVARLHCTRLVVFEFIWQLTSIRDTGSYEYELQLNVKFNQSLETCRLMETRETRKHQGRCDELKNDM